MTALSNITTVNITRLTSVIATQTFGVPAIISQFLPGATSQTFTRTRFYTSLAGLLADGWLNTDSVYLAAAQLLGQANKPAQFMVGRIDSGDANIGVSLSAIQLESQGWYCFSVIGQTSAAITLSTSLIASNSIASTIAGIVVPAQVFTTDHATTMTAWAAKIVTALTDAGFATPTATPVGNVMTVAQAGRDIGSVVVTITLGASQPTVATVYSQTAATQTGAAAWVATSAVPTMLGVADSDVNWYNSGSTTDLAYLLKVANQYNVWGIYHALPSEYIQFAWMGLELSKAPGASTWADKTLVNVTPDNLSETNRMNIEAKNGNTYTPIANTGRTLWGYSFAGELIDVQRNLDYAVALIQSDNANLKLSMNKVPANDSGVVLEENTLKGSCKALELQGVFQPGTSVTTSIPYSQWASADKASGTNRMTFTAGIQRAILKSTINGTLTL